MLKTKKGWELIELNHIRLLLCMVSQRAPFLGPLLFSLYMNDISADFESEITFFAEYCVYYRELKEQEDTTKTFRKTLKV